MKLYQVLQGPTEEFVVEILSQYLQGDSHQKSFIRGVLIDIGLQVIDRSSENIIG